MCVYIVKIHLHLEKNFVNLYIYKTFSCILCMCFNNNKNSAVLKLKKSIKYFLFFSFFFWRKAVMFFRFDTNRLITIDESDYNALN